MALEDVSLDFGGPAILNHANLLISEGESVVLIGPSGFGKSVILKLLTGLLRPSSGRILIEGQDLEKLDQLGLQRLVLKMGMLFQKNALFDSLTVGENIAFPLREVSSLSEDEIQERVTYFLDAVGLSHARLLFPDEISGGMQKRLGIARALALSPKMVFYDDPTAGLDPITSRKIVELILKLKVEYGSTIVSVTNDMARAYQLADRIALVTDGELIVTGTREETLRHPDPRVSRFIRGEVA